MRVRSSQNDAQMAEVERCTITKTELLNSRAALRDSKGSRTTTDKDGIEKDSAALRNDVIRRLSAMASFLKQDHSEMLDSSEETSTREEPTPYKGDKDEDALRAATDRIKALAENLSGMGKYNFALSTYSHHHTEATAPYTPLPPQTFTGQWRELFEVGMKVKLLTSTRDFLPARITRVHLSTTSLGHESYDVKLENGDVVLEVDSSNLQHADLSVIQKGVAPLRLSLPVSTSNKTTSAATSNPSVLSPGR